MVFELGVVGKTKKQDPETLSNPFLSLQLKISAKPKNSSSPKNKKQNKKTEYQEQNFEEETRMRDKRVREFRYQLPGLDGGGKNKLVERRARHFLSVWGASEHLMPLFADPLIQS